MAGTKRYTEEEQREFIETAQEIGISPAMRRLGFPGSYNTGLKFFEEAGLPRPDIDSLMHKAAEMKIMYSDNEKMFAAQAALDRIVEMFHEKDLDADAINKLTNALAKAIQTMQLIQNKATTIAETRKADDLDARIADEISAMKAQNALKIAEINKNR